REAVEERNIACGLALGLGDMDVRWAVVEEQVFDTDVDKLIHPCAGIEEGLDKQPILALQLIAGLKEFIDFGTIQSFDGKSACFGRRKLKRLADLLDDILGLVVIEVMFSPEFDGLVDNGSKFGIRGVRVRFCDLTTHLGGFWLSFSGHVYLGGMRMV